MRTAILQLNVTVGDLEGNRRKILSALKRVHKAGAQLAVFPEMTLPGYPPLDLLERPTFIQACADAESALIDEIPEGLLAIFGTVRLEAGRLVNAAIGATRGERLSVVGKALLPTYDVFDEARYFAPTPAGPANIVEYGGLRVGITICEDLWNDAELHPDRRYSEDPVESLVGFGAQVVVNLSASPWSMGRRGLRERLVKHAARRHGIWILLANQVGANDGLIFDGQSLAADPQGRLVGLGAAFEEDAVMVDLDGAPELPSTAIDDGIGDLHRALVVGVRDYFAKAGVERAAIALSGGIDSAVAAVLAVDALGPKNVIGLGMPSRYSSQGSVDDAATLAANLGIDFEVVSIEPIFEAFLSQLKPVFKEAPEDVTEENLQSRIRGTAIMALANKYRALAVTTGNKSESAVGYCTLYGDTNGGLAPLADLYKGQVYDLARHMNRTAERIPINTIDKAPSAELRNDQRDADSLPPYPVLDEILRLFLEEKQNADQIAVAVRQETSLVEDIIRKIYVNEFKRKQFPVVLRVSAKAWIGRVYPVAQAFRG